MRQETQSRARKHQYYEEQCALYAGYALPESEVEEFLEHLENCDECGCLLSDFLEIIALLHYAAVQEKRTTLRPGASNN
jgi:predicted anti-sigma-YlaC factor YlaD